MTTSKTIIPGPFILTKSKRPFTLLEVIICLALISIIGSIATLKGYELLKQHRLAYSERRLKEEIRLTKCLASTYQIDIDLTFIRKKAKVQLIRTTDLPPAKIAPLFNRPINLPYLQLEEEKVLHFTPSS